MTEKRDILYVDDERSNLLIFEASFEDDFNIHLCSSAGEALELLDKTPIPVVVSDQRMPSMTGVEMFRIIRRKYPHIQRVILSGYSEPEAVIQAINEGQVFQYVHKPWKRVDLLSVLLRALDAHDLLLQNSQLHERLVVSEQSAILGQMAAEITHDIGNNLSILPLVEWIELNHSDDQILLEFADIARQTHDHLVHLVDEVKNFIRRDIHEGVLRPINLADCVRELVSFLRFNRSVKWEQVHLTIEAEPTVPACKAKLHQVLLNLIKNAADAIERRADGRIDIVVGATADSGHFLVRDNGIGMDAETQSRMWDNLFSTKGARGTGLGMSVVQRLIAFHDGEINCQSASGRGTTFTVRLPFVSATENTDPSKLASPQVLNPS
jgi:signal transduction histidine kinase